MRRRRRDRPLQHLAEHLVLRPERLHAAVLHHQQHDRPPRSPIGRCATTTTMPPRSRTPQDRAGQRLVALGVEIGVGLVEHDQERIAIERARQRDALRLPGRQRGALLADLGVVALAAA